MVAMPKQNRKLRISLYPKDLNCAVLCERYTLPTFEDIAARLYGAKFSQSLIFEVASGILSGEGNIVKRSMCS